MPSSSSHRCPSCTFSTTSHPLWNRHQTQHLQARALAFGPLRELPSLRERLRREISQTLHVPFATDKARHFFHTELECSELEFFNLFSVDNFLLSGAIRYVADFYGPEGKDRLDAIFQLGWDSYTSPTTRTFVLFRDSCANYSFRVTASMRNRKFVCKTKFRLWKETV